MGLRGEKRGVGLEVNSCYQGSLPVWWMQSGTCVSAGWWVTTCLQGHRPFRRNPICIPPFRRLLESHSDMSEHHKWRCLFCRGWGWGGGVMSDHVIVEGWEVVHFRPCKWEREAAFCVHVNSRSLCRSRVNLLHSWVLLNTRTNFTDIKPLNTSVYCIIFLSSSRRGFLWVQQWHTLIQVGLRLLPQLDGSIHPINIMRMNQSWAVLTGV